MISLNLEISTNNSMLGLIVEQIILLPPELQDIILRYAGIRYPQTLDQATFAMDSIHRKNWIDQIIAEDNVEMIAMITKVLDPSLYSYELVVTCCAKYDAINCLEYWHSFYTLGLPCQVVKYMEKALKICIKTNSIRVFNLIFNINGISGLITRADYLRMAIIHDRFEIWQTLMHFKDIHQCIALRMEKYEIIDKDLIFASDEEHFLWAKNNKQPFHVVTTFISWISRFPPKDIIYLLVSCIICNNVDGIMLILDQGFVITSDIIARGIVGCNLQTLEFVDSKISGSRDNPRVITQLLRARNRSPDRTSCLKYLLQKGYPVDNNTIQDAIRDNSRELSILLQYTSEKITVYGFPRIETLIALKEYGAKFTINPLFNAIRYGDPKIVEAMNQLQLPYPSDFYFLIVDAKYRMSYKIKIMQSCINHGYRIEPDAYEHALTLGPNYQLIKEMVISTYNKQ